MYEVAANAAAYFVERHATSAYRDKVAFREAAGQGRSLTYLQLAGEAAKLPHLLERHGIQRENRAALLLLDAVEYPSSFGVASRRASFRSFSTPCSRPTSTPRF